MAMLSVRTLSALDVGSIRTFLASCEQPWEPSELYATATSENVLEDSIRKSESQTIVDPQLWEGSPWSLGRVWARLSADI